MKSVRRIAAVFAAVVTAAFAALLVSGASASAAPTPCPAGDPGLGGCTASVGVSQSVVAQGASDTASGFGFSANSTVTGVGHSDPATLFSNVATSATGTFSAAFTVPSDFPIGEHTLVVTDAAGQSASSAFLVVAATTPSSTPPSTSPSSSTSPNSNLAITGTAVIGIGSLAVILLLGGSAMLFVGRRRTDGTHH